MAYRLLDETEECVLVKECDRKPDTITTCDGEPMCAEHFAEHLLDCGACASDVADSMDLED
jgi:hypothetical protein